MPLLIAFLAGFLFLEAAPDPEVRWFAQGAGWWQGLAQPSLWIALTGMAWAASTQREGRAAWGTLVAFAGGASLSTLMLPTPFFRLGPLVGGAALLLLIAVAEARQNAPREERAPDRLRIAAWVLAGWASALPLMALLRRVWRLGMSEGADFQITGWVTVALLAFGAIAFGRLVPATRLGWGAGLSLGVYGLACLAGHRAAETLATHRGLRSLVRRFELDLSYAGTHVYGVLVGVSILILPLFALGACLHCLPNRGQRYAWALGTGLGVWSAPQLLEQEWAWSHAWGPTSVLLATGVGAVGFVAAGLLFLGRSRVWGAGMAASTLIACFLYPFDMVVQAKPWSRAVKDVQWAYDAPKGQLAILTEGMHGFAARFDQRQVTPTLEWQRLDQRLVAASLEASAVGRANAPRVLFSGLLTPERYEVLVRYGVTRLDRVAPYWRFGKPTEKRLFQQDEHGHDGHDHAGHDHGQAVPDGDWLGPRTAWKRLQEGRYDLVIAPPEAMAFPAVPAGVLQVAWQIVDDRVAERPAPADDQPWWLLADGLQRFAVGTVSGEMPASIPRGVWPVAAGSATSLANRWRWMGWREWERPEVARAGFFERIASAAPNPERRELWLALSALQSMQKHSSPFESEAQRLEWNDEVIERMSRGLLALPPDPFVEEMAGGLARILVGKREVGPLMRWMPELSQHLGQPYELERSLARGELESLQPEAAAERLARLRSRFPEDRALLRELAIAYDQSGQAKAAHGIWALVLAEDPTDFEAEKAWVMALLRAGDARAKDALQSLQARFPDDLGLQGVSQNGPYPVPEPSFQPIETRHEGHDHPE